MALKILKQSSYGTLAILLLVAAKRYIHRSVNTMNSNEEVVESSSASKSTSNRETTASQQDSTATAIRGDPAPTNKDVSKDETLDPKNDAS